MSSRVIARRTADYRAGSARGEWFSQRFHKFGVPTHAGRSLSLRLPVFRRVFKQKGDSMKKALRIQAGLAAAVLALAMAHTARADHGVSGNDGTQEVRLRARMTGAAIQGVTPSGSGDFRSETGRTRLQVEVEHVNLPAGTVLTVSVQSGANAPVQIGTIKLSSTGFGELDLESDKGAVVPAILNGDVLSVANAGTTILAGAFGPA
jgi:hypothetical protein